MRHLWPALLIASIMLAPIGLILILNWHFNRLDAMYQPAPTTGDDQ